MSGSMLNPITIVHKANQRASLSPGQRALLKVIKEVGYFLLTTGFAQSPQLAQAIQGHNVSLESALISQLVAGVLQILMTGLDKYLSAQGDVNYTLVKNSVLETLYKVFQQQTAGQGAPTASPVPTAPAIPAPTTPSAGA